jgi:hypothetical protein
MIFPLDTKIVPTGDRFDIDILASSGLSLRVRGGYILTQTGPRSVANATLTLTASATNFVEMSDAGVISANTTGFTDGYTPLYVVTTGTALVTGIQDYRGRSGTLSEQTLTVSGAIRDDAEFVKLNATTPLIAATIASIRPGRFLVITQIDAGTAGHTVTIAGGGTNTFDGTNEIATLNAAGEALVLYGLSATRFALILNLGSVALSS